MKSKSRTKKRKAESHPAAAPTLTHPITCRDDLPFVTRDKDDCRVDWNPTRSEPAADHARRTGMLYAQAVARLAEVDEFEAYCAIRGALHSKNWNPDGGEEHGFVEGLVQAVIIGWRAMAIEEELPFSTTFDPLHSSWCSLNTRADVMEIQLKSMNVRPWRTYAEASLA